MRMLILIFVSLLIVIGCKTKKHGELSSKDLIKDLIIKYPQLGVDHNNIPVLYMLNRHVIDNDWDAEFELHKAGNYEGKILILRKGTGAYAIPLFRPAQADYWQMDSLYLTDVKTKVNTTFGQELKTANKRLKLSKHDFFHIRYIFQHVLLLQENFTDPCADELEMPYKLKYKGNYTFIISVHSRDSLSIKSEPIITM